MAQKPHSFGAVCWLRINRGVSEMADNFQAGETGMDYEWEVIRVDLDGLERELRLLAPTNPRR